MCQNRMHQVKTKLRCRILLPLFNLFFQPHKTALCLDCTWKRFQSSTEPRSNKACATGWKDDKEIQTPCSIARLVS